MSHTHRNERAALNRYFGKHFFASPPVDQEWYKREANALSDLINHDPIYPTYAEAQAINERFIYNPTGYPYV